MRLSKLQIASFLSLSMLVIGTIGYHFFEGYPFIDAFYMTIITITTVGFGEIHPLSPAGRLFTIGVLLVGFSSLAFATHSVVESLISRILSSKSEKDTMKERIENINGHYIVCGYGRVGAAAVEQFVQRGVDFVIVESNPAMIAKLKEQNYLVVEGDATDETTLIKAGIKRAKGVLAMLPSDPENLFISLTARELNPLLHIISRAEDMASEKKILRGGADRVVSPFLSAGQQIAEEMLAATGRISGLSVGTSVNMEPQWIEIHTGSSMIGMTISHVAEEMGRDIIGLRRNGKDSLMPDKNTRLKEGDQLLILDEAADEVNRPELEKKQKKVLIVDDNMVILRFYSRLLQKSGFLPIMATNGQEALNKLREEKPDVAVIDYQLPVLSGIDVCRKAKKELGLSDTTFILFTSDRTPHLKEEALNAGADIFLLKSSESGELLKTVIDALNAKTNHAQPEKSASSSDRPPEPQADSRWEELLSRFEGDEELLREVLTVYLEDVDNLLQKIGAEITDWSKTDLRKSLHSLAGTLAAIKQDKLKKRLETVQDAVHKEDRQKARTVYSLLQRQIVEFNQWVREQLS